MEILNALFRTGTLYPVPAPVFLCTGSDAVDGLKNAHFNVLSVANNHSMENGQQSFMHTLQILKNHAITPVGIRGRFDILPVKGYRIAFLAYSFIEDNIVNGCYNKIQSEETILEEIQKVKADTILSSYLCIGGMNMFPTPRPIKSASVARLSIPVPT